MAVILACAKKVAVSESREIACVAYLGQIMNIGSGRARNLIKECSRDCQDIGVRDNGCRLKTARNRMGIICWPNNKYWKLLRAKILNGALPGGLGY